MCVVLALLIVKMCRVLQEYRAQFLLVITGVLRQHRLGGSCGLRRIFCPNRAV